MNWLSLVGAEGFSEQGGKMNGEGVQWGKGKVFQWAGWPGEENGPCPKPLRKAHTCNLVAG